MGGTGSGFDFSSFFFPIAIETDTFIYNFIYLRMDLKVVGFDFAVITLCLFDLETFSSMSGVGNKSIPVMLVCKSREF